VREQIAALEKKVQALKGKLPAERVVIVPILGGTQYVPVPYPVIPQVIRPWNGGYPYIFNGIAHSNISTLCSSANSQRD
jgi:hypothetical protein